MTAAVEIARILLERQIEKLKTAAGGESPNHTPAAAKPDERNARRIADHTINRPRRQTEARK